MGRNNGGKLDSVTNGLKLKSRYLVEEIRCCLSEEEWLIFVEMIIVQMPLLVVNYKKVFGSNIGTHLDS